MLRYAITNGGTTLRSAVPLVERCSVLARSGVDFVLVREKKLAPGELAALAGSIVAAIRETGSETRVLIAHRVDVAIAAGADGVHLSARKGELTPRQVRALMPEGLVSVSCHTLEEVTHARDGGASAVLFGPVFGKTVDGVEVVAGVGLDKLREACAIARTLGVFALGSVTEVNAERCIEAGAEGIAGIRMFFG